MQTNESEVQQKRYIMMTQTPVSRLIPKLAVPTIISMLITALYNIADTYFVSSLSTDAAAAVGVVFSLMSLIQAFGFMMGMGSGNFVSQLLGRKDYETAEKVTAIVKENFGDLLNPLQNGTCIDIVRADMDKAKGIYLLLDFLGAEHKDVIAVGDNINDLAMIEEFRSYAMDNGVELVKSLADGTVSSVTELIEKELRA